MWKTSESVCQSNSSRKNPLLIVIYHIWSCLFLYRVEVTPISESDFVEIIACSSQYESSACFVQIFYDISFWCLKSSACTCTCIYTCTSASLAPVNIHKKGRAPNAKAWYSYSTVVPTTTLKGQLWYFPLKVSYESCWSTRKLGVRVFFCVIALFSGANIYSLRF